eukprot:jgi/Bigna1/78540/fgenesh1_pg.55_\
MATIWTLHLRSVVVVVVVVGMVFVLFEWLRQLERCGFRNSAEDGEEEVKKKEKHEKFKLAPTRLIFGAEDSGSIHCLSPRDHCRDVVLEIVMTPEKTALMEKFVSRLERGGTWDGDSDSEEARQAMRNRVTLEQLQKKVQPAAEAAGRAARAARTHMTDTSGYMSANSASSSHVYVLCKHQMYTFKFMHVRRDITVCAPPCVCAATSRVMLACKRMSSSTPDSKRKKTTADWHENLRVHAKVVVPPLRGQSVLRASLTCYPELQSPVNSSRKSERKTRSKKKKKSSTARTSPSAAASRSAVEREHPAFSPRATSTLERVHSPFSPRGATSDKVKGKAGEASNFLRVSLRQYPELKKEYNKMVQKRNKKQTPRKKRKSAVKKTAVSPSPEKEARSIQPHEKSTNGELKVTIPRIMNDASADERASPKKLSIKKKMKKKRRGKTVKEEIQETHPHILNPPKMTGKIKSGATLTRKKKKGKRSSKNESHGKQISMATSSSSPMSAISARSVVKSTASNKAGKEEDAKTSKETAERRSEIEETAKDLDTDLNDIGDIGATPNLDDLGSLDDLENLGDPNDGKDKMDGGEQEDLDDDGGFPELDEAEELLNKLDAEEGMLNKLDEEEAMFELDEGDLLKDFSLDDNLEDM